MGSGVIAKALVTLPGVVGDSERAAGGPQVGAVVECCRQESGERLDQDCPQVSVNVLHAGHTAFSLARQTHEGHRQAEGYLRGNKSYRETVGRI